MEALVTATKYGVAGILILCFVYAAARLISYAYFRTRSEFNNKD